MDFLRSLKSLFRRIIKKLLKRLSRTELIIIASSVVGIILTIAIISVHKINSPKNIPPSDSSVDISISEDGSGSNGQDGLSITETASAETKVESTDATTELAFKENALKGYLNRCVFLGDSRTVAMVNYGFLNDDAALAQIGISHPSFSNNRFMNNAGKEYTLKSYLESHQAPVVYVALGVNGINDPSEDHYKSTYTELVDRIVTLAPNSNIVLMSIGPVDDNGPYKNTVQNSWINKYNDFLLDLAKEKHIFYLNIAEVLTGENGQVKSEYNGGDGLHYSNSGCQAIFDYIVSHPVPGIEDDGEYVVKYVKPKPRNVLDEAKMEELLTNTADATATPLPTEIPAVTASPTVTATPAPEYNNDEEEEERKRQEAEEAKRKEKEKEEAKAREQEEAKKKEEEEAAKKAQEEADRKAREEAEKKAQEEAEKKAQEEAEKKAQEEAEKKAQEEADRKAQEEAEKKAQEEADRKAQEEADRKAQEEEERKAAEEAAKNAEQSNDSGEGNDVDGGGEGEGE